ncbi:MAG: hypothetical protein K5777_06720 [Nitrosopumilus sp.]|nr:hypothetical protein [Nitrosopumilus sp.]
MVELGKYHARTFYINGLNLGEERFIWDDKLMIMDGGNKEGNIAVAHILFEQPMPEMGTNTEDYVDAESRLSAKGIHLVSVFLACFKLSNSMSYYPRINRSMHGGHPLKSIEDFKSYGHKNNPFLNTDMPKESVENNLKFLENTIPLFDKVMKNIDFEQKRQKNPLALSLPIFQKIHGIDIESVIDYSTVLESLVCENEGELKFKFALRTSLLISNDSKSRKELFDFLKKVYNIRSSLVHGSEISFRTFSREHVDIVLNLENIVKRALLEYLEFVNSGLSKKEIIGKLDEKALGISDDQ